MSLDPSKIKLGIAPINWTNDDLPELGGDIPFETCTDEMAKAGYVGSEIGNKYPKDKEELLNILNEKGLSICNAWFSTFFTIKEFDKTIEEFIKHRDKLHYLGAKVIGCSEQGHSIQGTSRSIFDEKYNFTNDEFKMLADGYDELTSLAKEKDMIVSFHHHMGTGVQTRREIDKFMNITQGKVKLLYDTGHIYYSENTKDSVLSLIKDYIDEIAHIHLKDVRDSVINKVKNEKLSFLDGVKLGTFTVPGDGDIDFEPVFEIIENSSYSGWMVVEAEQDPAIANPFEYAKKSREYIKKLTYL